MHIPAALAGFSPSAAAKPRSRRRGKNSTWGGGGEAAHAVRRERLSFPENTFLGVPKPLKKKKKKKGVTGLC